MNKFWEKVEHYNAKLIPVAIVALLFIIVFELFLHIENHAVELVIHILDYFVLAVFVIDIIFLAIKARGVKFFFKHYWLDLLAIIPIILVLTILTYLFSAVFAIGKWALGQTILHESLEVRKITTAVAREGKLLSKSGKFARGIRIFTRGLRAVTKSRLFTEFKTKHHLARRGIKTRKYKRKSFKMKKKP